MIVDNFLKLKNLMNGNLEYGSVGNTSTNAYSTFSDIYAIENTSVSTNVLYIFAKFYNFSNSYLSEHLAIIQQNSDMIRVDDVKPSAATSFSKSDVDIANKIANVTMQSVTNNRVIKDNKITNTVKATFSNSNSSPVTINSVGLYKTVLWRQYVNSSTQGNKVLMAEVPLSTPITVPAGSGFTITAVWDENEPG